MATDLTPGERDDREAERLLDHKPAPSRKYREKRAPRPYQRQRRVRDQDTDTASAVDEDLDRYVRDLDSVMKGLDSDDDDFDFDEAIKALRDPKAESEADLKEALRRSDLDPSRMDELDRALGLSAASNGTLSPMSPRTGAYHGVRDVRGNPTDPPGSSYAGPDRRDFTEKDYDAIIKMAAKLLDEDWLKHGWDGGSEDAPKRAALDLAIQTAGDGALYQSKIDAETYDLLLNRLAKWGYDTFSDTVLPMKAPQSGRSASAMKNSQSYKDIVRVASELRETNPVASMALIKGLRSLVSTEAPEAPSIREHATAPSATVAAVVAGPGIKVSDQPFHLARDGGNQVVSSGDDLAEVPLSTLMKVAATSPSAKAALGPFILAAAKKKKDKKKGKGKVPPQFLKNMKGKGDAPPSKGKKASIASGDASW